MTATSHAAIGVTIAALIPDPVIGLPVSFLSHILCDMTPHWDAGTHMKKKSTMQLTLESIIDVLLSIIVTLFMLIYIFPRLNMTYGLFSAFISQLLDWLTVPYLFLNMKFAPFSWVAAFQRKINIRLDKPWGIITQVTVVFVCILIAKIVQL